MHAFCTVPCLEKKSYPLNFADKQVKFFLENKINENSDTVNAKTVLLSIISYLTLAIFQQMLNIRLIGLVSITVKV